MVCSLPWSLVHAIKSKLTLKKVNLVLVKSSANEAEGGAVITMDKTVETMQLAPLGAVVDKVMGMGGSRRRWSVRIRKGDCIDGADPREIRVR